MGSQDVPFCFAISALGFLTLGLFIAVFKRLERYSRHVSKEIFSGLHVLFVTAHPDDECMFFGPSVTAATKYASRENVHLLCLSTGDFDRRGNVRKLELLNSCQRLGILGKNVHIIDDKRLPDSPHVEWNVSIVSEVLARYMKKVHADLIVTFDRQGVSSHPNHISLWKAVRHTVARGRLPANVKAYALETCGIMAKYVGLLGISSSLSARYFVLADLTQWRQAQAAMSEHRSQLVWFRYLYVVFSRYMWLNTLQPIDPAPSPAMRT